MPGQLVAAGSAAFDPASRRLLLIGEVADRTVLSLRTLRHYEDVGLLPPAERARAASGSARRRPSTGCWSSSS